MKNAGIVMALFLLAGALSFGADAPVAPGIQVKFWAGNTPQVLERSADAGALPVKTLDDIPSILTIPVAVNLGTVEQPEWYLLKDEGLYRIYKDGTCIQQVIRYSGDILRLAGHLSRIQVHGFVYEWNKRTIPALDETMRTGQTLRIQCGPTCNFAVAKYKELGLQARYMGALPIADFNGWNDGHALVEVFFPTEKRWILIDQEMGVAFKDKGQYLDMLQVIEVYRADRQPELEILNADTKIDPNEDYAKSLAVYKADPKEVAQFVGVLKHEPDALHGYYKHVFGVPLATANEFGAYSDKDREAIVGWKNFKHLKPLSIDEFRKKYYPPR